MTDNFINGYREKLEQAFERFLPRDDCSYRLVIEAMRYSLFAGGKRVRPILLCEFYKLCGGKDDHALPFAVALEMIHTYSLIHDDLPCMDNDDYRRGRLSNHKKFGQDMALLAGDGLLTHAFFVAAQTTGISSDNVQKAFSVLAFRAGYHGMIGGQVIDLQSEGKTIPVDTITQLNLLKTGGLLQAAAEIGCILAGADERKVELAAQYGAYVGQAFQIIDDILDETATPDVLGKPIGSDDKNKKSTFVSAFGVEKCRSMAEKLTGQAVTVLNSFDGDSSVLNELTKMLLKRSY